MIGKRRAPRAALTGLLVATMVLAGCGGRPVGVMQAAGTVAPGTSKVDLLVATTRAADDNPAVLFSGERGTGLAVNAVDVSIPPEANRKVGQVQWPSRLPADPLRDFVTISVDPLEGERAGETWLKTHMPKSRRVLVFVHGFNNRYEDAVYRFAQIVHDSHADVAPVVFTWPSRGSIFDYNYDKESTNYSRDALEELLTRTAANPAVSDVTIMAHSMGTWLTVEALRQMAIRNGHVASKINNVILASPDLDVDVFGRQFASLGKERPHFTIFVSQDDRALALSRRISGNVDRLGQIDPSVEPYRSKLEAAGITVLDLTKLKGGDRLNHGKFAESPEVVKLIGDRLIAGQAITDSNVGLGEAVGAVAMGAAQTAGSAVSVAVSTPIAIFDPRTRRNYDAQLKRLGQSMNNTVGSVGDSVGASLPESQ
ncbi:alpha/beta hydrolase [Rhizobium leguminosarum]|uniref:Alpha/beta fold hydrolase n=1 Tax=Rhizobium leguminosarum TaxID=384 RepID=A0A6P0DC31_RHILE|nr:alpha/beta hydrolase [Rhizobium leguminosarum]ASS54662.1 alpha/beta hydrolase [Rhizobium leguminosarum bv. viciae]AVC48019.1 alpha/beta hydrolase family protein [Rhizobium leguminosarum bv. viciae]MBB4328204.1 esterase/lipase superfamily enzyme [Rhizobium leguminosarum]MBB4341633.1 esterase/lipase superfamily enzyme [Rhizobium leguminosarum]MBB4353870.1 esterase/lipase superfamily enzyme [Rhizobium leguminosarum]